MRELKRIILHCSATREGQELDADTIRSWHLARGWSDIGYHYVVKLDGSIEPGRPLHRIGAHAKGHNADSIGICYVGGLDASGDPRNTMTAEQRSSITRICVALCVTFNQRFTLHAHNEFSSKACPSFAIADTFEELASYCASYDGADANEGPLEAVERPQHCSWAYCTCSN